MLPRPFVGSRGRSFSSRGSRRWFILSLDQKFDCAVTSTSSSNVNPGTHADSCSRSQSFRYAAKLLASRLRNSILSRRAHGKALVEASALALSLYAVVAMEIKAPRLLKIYAVLLAALTITDFFWLATYAGPIGSGTTGMTVTVGPNSANIDSSLMSIKWGLLASSVNNFFCLVPELFAFFVRVASVALWVLMWSKGLLDGSDDNMYNDPNSAYDTGLKHETIPGSPARNGSKASDMFTAEGGYQDSEGLLSRAV